MFPKCQKFVIRTGLPFAEGNSCIRKNFAVNIIQTLNGYLKDTEFSFQLLNATWKTTI